MLHRLDYSRVEAGVQPQIIQLPYGPALISEAAGNLVLG